MSSHTQYRIDITPYLTPITMPHLPQLDSRLQSNFYLSYPDIQSCDKHFILFWETEYLLTQISRDNTITRDGICYLLTTNLHDLGAYTSKIKISFRRNAYEPSQCYCLVRPDFKPRFKRPPSKRY